MENVTREQALNYLKCCGFLLVHSGGHHEVFCNGKAHLTCASSVTWVKRVPQYRNARLSLCNCSCY